MRTPPDLHSDDLATRGCLRDILVDARVGYNMSQRDLATALGRGRTAVALMETTLTWRMSTVQRWARAVRLRLVLAPSVIDIDEAIFLLRPADPDAALAFDRRVYIEALRDARRELRVTQRALGERLGITENGVAEMEKERDMLILNAQRYCRALGCDLSIGLDELDPTWQA